MTREQIELVESTWAQVAAIKEQAAALFYGRLFELDPSVKPMFRGDLGEQGAKLMAVLGAAVAGLKRLDGLLPVLRELGRRHAGYGVTDAHYDTVRAALLWTLGQGLGGGFTPEVRTAWGVAYDLLAGVMKSAAQASAA
jgi:hemoglobin-like flavoprotein